MLDILLAKYFTIHAEQNIGLFESFNKENCQIENLDSIHPKKGIRNFSFYQDF